jgi:hypothetical protein
MLISNPLKTLQTNSWEKSYHRKSDRKMKFLTLVIVCKSFPSITFLG